MSSARRGARRRQLSFHYMNSRVSFKIERPQSRHSMRSHISSRTQQLVKHNSGELESDDIHESYAQDRAENNINIEAAGSTSSSASLSNRSKGPHWVVGNRARGSHDENGQALTRTDKLRGRAASSPSLSLYSIDYTSAGTLDPFQTYPSSFPPGFVNRCIKYC
jgi:hypothetical protein